jgi:pimeloyl-ACP methyl ester carboxylesterase
MSPSRNRLIVRLGVAIAFVASVAAGSFRLPADAQMKARSARISYRWQRRGHATWGTIPTSNAMTRISGPMNVRSSASQARPTFKATSSTTTARTSMATPKWQAWMREKQPRLLVIWGKYDLSFELSEPEAYRRDVPNAQVHVLDAGHFALDTAADDIADFVRGFVGPSH